MDYCVIVLKEALQPETEFIVFVHRINTHNKQKCISTIVFIICSFFQTPEEKQDMIQTWAEAPSLSKSFAS